MDAYSRLDSLHSKMHVKTLTILCGFLEGLGY